MGLYVNCCVRGPPNPISCELVQCSDIHIVRGSTRACCPPRLQRITNFTKIQSIILTCKKKIVETRYLRHVTTRVCPLWGRRARRPHPGDRKRTSRHRMDHTTTRSASRYRTARTTIASATKANQPTYLSKSSECKRHTKPST
jgi:hypothetical protein